MRHAILIAGVLMAALLLGGCASEEGQATGKAVHTTTDAPEEAAAEAVTHEIRLDGDRFAPDTVTAEPGQDVELQFLLDEPRHVSVYGLGVTEHVQHDTITLSNVAEGEYPVVCLDCEEGATVTLVVE